MRIEADPDARKAQYEEANGCEKRHRLALLSEAFEQEVCRIEHEDWDNAGEGNPWPRERALEIGRVEERCRKADRADQGNHGRRQVKGEMSHGFLKYAFDF